MQQQNKNAAAAVIKIIFTAARSKRERGGRIQTVFKVLPAGQGTQETFFATDVKICKYYKKT
ncbi:MAG: hypothetical protein Q4G07_03110 [Oscillospiraceae bacterium]|nr:hypothetical protein [Oscillospiraceae bacterium]